MLERLFGRKKTSKQTETESQDAPAHAETETGGAEPLAATDASESPRTGLHAAELERAMDANVAMDNPETRLKVYQELLFSELLLCLADEKKREASEEAAADTSNATPNALRVAILKNQANMAFACAFTSEAAARKWRPQGGHFAGVKGQDIFKILDGSPAEVVVINPGSTPFVVLPQIDYRQLALGVVPQNPQSPVQNPKPATQNSDGGAKTGDEDASSPDDQAGQMQLAFPKDVFTEEQHSLIKTILLVHTNVEAAVYGALKPPDSKENDWIRTIFLRVRGLEPKQEIVQTFTTEIRNSILENQALFKETPFEIGVMPDPQFWLAMHQNNLVALDKNPPKIPEPSAEATSEKPSGVVDAKVTP